METFDEKSYRAEVEELRGQGEDVLSGVCVRGRGWGSGIEIEDRAYIHAKVRAGKIVHIYEYVTRDEALEAAGLRE